MTRIIENTTSQSRTADRPIPVAVPDPRECLLELARRPGTPPGRPMPHRNMERTYGEPSLMAGASPLIWGPATFVLPAEGDAIRPVVTFRRALGTCSFLSVKSGRTQVGEGPHEFHALQALEVDPNVADYQCQPFSVRWDTSEGPRAYTPDIIVALTDGTLEVWEVKADWSYFHDPEYAEKITYARTALAGINVGFREVVAEHLERPRIAAFNIARVFNHRFTQILPTDEQAVADALACRGGEAPLSTIEEALHPDPRIARAKADALLCRRRIVFSLTAPVIADTLVTAAAPPPGDLRDIRNLGL